MLTDLFLLLVIVALCAAIWRAHRTNIDAFEYIKAKLVSWWMDWVFRR